MAQQPAACPDTGTLCRLAAKEIGSALEISARTVEFHKYHMMQRLNVHTNAELVHCAIKLGIVEL